MEQVIPRPWLFDVPPDTAVVTTSYVTKDRQPILYVTHEYDEDEGVIWQFHCGNGDYDPGVLQLVRLDEILEMDGSIAELAGLPPGFCAKRPSAEDKWTTEGEALSHLEDNDSQEGS
jgi:hypothetical protein